MVLTDFTKPAVLGIAEVCPSVLIFPVSQEDIPLVEIDVNVNANFRNFGIPLKESQSRPLRIRFLWLEAKIRHYIGPK